MAWSRIAGFFRRGNGSEGALTANESPAPDGIIEELRGYIARDLRGGYMDHATIIDGALEVVDVQPHGEARLRVQAQQLLEEECAAYRNDAAGWPVVTDHDRLELAFSELQSQGVVCRQNFTCCGTCGVAEIGDEMQVEQARGGPVQGYAFFHMQDTESAIDGHGLWLNFGAAEAGEAAAVAVARAVVAAISAAGLSVEWDGDWSKRIFVRMQWQRRLAL